MSKENNECDMVVTLTIPFVPNCEESFRANLGGYLNGRDLSEGLIIVESIQMVNERYVEERDE